MLYHAVGCSFMGVAVMTESIKAKTDRELAELLLNISNLSNSQRRRLTRVLALIEAIENSAGEEVDSNE